MAPLPAELTLVVDDPLAVYSGMFPGLIEGRYPQEALEIDARPLARRAGVRVIHARALRCDPAARLLHVEGRPPLPYDVLSLNLGSTVAGRSLPGVREHALPTRPLSAMIEQLTERLKALPPSPKVVIVGAGAGGVELAFCLHTRLLDRHPEVHLLFRGDRVLPDQHPRVAARVTAAAAARGITLHPHTDVLAVDAQAVQTDSGALESDLTVWVTGAAGLSFGRDSGLPVDDRGFVKVGPDLRVEGHDDLFAVGDCAVLSTWPEIPKAGVYAVREGPVLRDNLRRLLEGRPLSDYRPQRDFFGILNLGDGTALGSKWGLPVQGRWVMAFKDRIDRAFMAKFQVLDPDGAVSADFSAGMPTMDESAMVCGGCAAKVAQAPLMRVLERLPPTTDSRIQAGIDAADDVVAWEEHGTHLLQNVDLFSAFVDDPFTVGRVAARNATSDLWAKGVKPGFAMAIVQLPESADPEQLLFEVMSGIRHSLDDEGVALLGGHTTVGDKLVVGLTVTAVGEPVRWANHTARPGDTLVLTRPLGTGVLFHADMAGRARGNDVVAALVGMCAGNRAASLLAREHPIHAATDVTGFGLAGHLAVLCRASRVGATLHCGALPVLSGVLPLLARGERSTFHDQNREVLKAVAVQPGAATHPHFELLFDPQTVGGLLFATPDPTALLSAFADHGAWAIGTCTEPPSSGALFEVLP